MIPQRDSGFNFTDRLKEAGRFHMGMGLVHETLRSLAADLEHAGIPYALVDGMALNAHGYRRETTDVDVLVRPTDLGRFRDQFEGRGYVPAFIGAQKSFRNTQTRITVEFLTTGEFPGDGKPKPVAFPNALEVTLRMEGFNVVNLPTLINLKLASGMTVPARRRDLADVQDLIRTVGLDESFAESLAPYVQPMYRTLLQELRDDDSSLAGRDAR